MAGRVLRYGTRLGGIALIAGCASLAAAGPAAASAPCEAEIPVIKSVALDKTSFAGATVQAEIDTRGRETSYEFAVVWQESAPPHGEAPPAGVGVQTGRIAAGTAPVTVHALLSGLQAGDVYWFEVSAANEAGEARSEARMFEYFYTGGFPEGSGGGAPYRPVGPCWAIESGQRAAEQTVREAREREAAKLAQEEAERKAREQAALVQVHPVTCRVPALRGDSLRRARRVLERAHCRLGTVRRPRHSHGALVVIRQGARRGRTLAGGTQIAVTLGPPAAGRRR